MAVPAAIRPEIVKHLMTYVDPALDALVFTGPKGGVLRRAHFNNLTRWVETVWELGALACTSTISGTRGTCSPRRPAPGPRT